MAINKKLIHFNTKVNFNTQLLSGNILDTSIVFIKETKEIWTHGLLYPCPLSLEEITTLLSKKVDKVTGKSLVSDSEIEKLLGLPNNAELNNLITTAKAAGDNAQSDLNTHKLNKSNPHEVTKAQVGLGNVDNTSDANKPVSTAQATAIADAKKAGTDALTAVTAEVTRAKAAEEAIQTALDNHKADKDKKHIPAGGHERQILAWDEEGKAKWDDLANMFTGLEELLAYGVEWDITVSDPHITRIGNMSMHKTLPIQSLLKGCIALGDKVIYWLNENDWRYRKDPIIIRYTAETESNMIISSELASLIAAGLYLKITTGSSTSSFRLVYVTSIHNDEIYFNAADGMNHQVFHSRLTYNIEICSRLDGYDGTVRVYCPNFYIKSERKGNKRRVWLSTIKIDNTWTCLHEILIDAYRSTVLNTVPENMGYLSTLPVNSAISVVNTATYCRGGGNRDANDKYLTGADDTTIDIFRTDLGKPRTNHPRSSMRTEARKAGSEMLSYDQYKNIFYWLYVVEYANFNCLEAYNAKLTDDGYHQGGLGNGVTNVSNDKAFNGRYPITPCGYGNDLGNGTGVKLITSPGLTPANGVYMCRWRGFDNPFGDIWTNLDGIIIDADADNHPNNMNYVYTCQDPAKYADSLNDSYEKVGEEVHQDGYTKLFDLGDSAHIIPNVIGGNTTQCKCDYHLTDSKNTTLRMLVVGGGAADGANAGLGTFYSGLAAVSGFWYNVGFRSVSRFVSFSSLK